MPDFDELVDLLRERLLLHDRLKPNEAHSFKQVMKDKADLIGDTFYWEAFEELMAQGHLDPKVSSLGNLRDAFGRLSADGRLYLRQNPPA